MAWVGSLGTVGRRVRRYRPKLPVTNAGAAKVYNTTKVLLAGTTSWTPPAGVTEVFVECLGPGGRGYANSSSPPASTARRHGGGSGGYSAKTLTVTPGTPETVQISAENSEQPTWFRNNTTVLAPAGFKAIGTSRGLGGTGGIGDVVNDGAAGGTASGAGGGGGAGAASPLGIGRAGGSSTNSGNSGAGAGGGGVGGGSSSNGVQSTTNDVGTAGGNGPLGTGGGPASTAATAGTGGGGGGGGNSTGGGREGAQYDLWTDTASGITYGPGGGSGGGRGNSLAPGGYGAGSGGGATVQPATPGLIVLHYDL